MDLGPMYRAGFHDGAMAAIKRASKWLDEETVESLKEHFTEKRAKE